AGVKRWLDQRYRAAASTEATGRPWPGDDTRFVGDGPCPPSLARDGHGVLVITAQSSREDTWNGTRLARVPATDPNAWLPWPSLTIDGTPYPLSWRTWCYRLPAGVHEVRVEPETVRVTVSAGRVTRLDVTVSARIAVSSASGDRGGPSELSGF